MTPRQIDAEEYLNLKFKKGDKRRGQAMVLLAEAKLEERERILKIVDKLDFYHYKDYQSSDRANVDVMCRYGGFDKLKKELINEIKEIKK